MSVTLPPPIEPEHPAPCSIEGCARPAQGRSAWCHTHYEHNRRYGRPEPLTVGGDELRRALTGEAT